MKRAARTVKRYQDGDQIANGRKSHGRDYHSVRYLIAGKIDLRSAVWNSGEPHFLLLAH
jgi:hypothetical protein